MSGFPRSIVVVRLGALGDVVNALCFARAVKAHAPATRVAWVVHELARPLVEGPPDVDRVHLWPRRSGARGFLRCVRELRAARYELAVDLQRIAKSAALALKEGLDTLRASTELRDSSSLEIELRTQLGSVYESVKKYALAAQQYGTVLKNLDPDHEHARRGYDRVKDRDEAPAGGGRDAVTRREER